MENLSGGGLYALISIACAIFGIYFIFVYIMLPFNVKAIRKTLEKILEELKK